MVPVFVTVFGVATNIARGTGKLKACNALLSVRVFTNVILSIRLVPKFGIGGPVLGLMISNILFGDALFFPFLCKTCNLSARKAWKAGWRISLVNAPAAGIALAILHRIEIHTWPILLGVTTLLTLVFYGTLYFCFVGDSEKRDLLHALDALGMSKIPALQILIRKILKIS